MPKNQTYGLTVGKDAHPTADGNIQSIIATIASTEQFLLIFIAIFGKVKLWQSKNNPSLWACAAGVAIS